ncbi:MAG: 1,2-dihydroxy-3-keto-5-methylthiopentene dioxygenase [Nevskiales bacterium]
MSELRIYSDQGGSALKRQSNFDDIAASLDGIGVLFERWRADVELDPEANQDEVIEAYCEPIDRLMSQYGFQSVDVVGMHPEHPSKDELREKFLHEHRHGDFEVRFFVDGAGLFYIHHQDKVYVVHCTRGDLISVPANTPHWFDMGAKPYFKAIRLFTTAEGWVAKYTGDDIARRFPNMDEFLAEPKAA